MVKHKCCHAPIGGKNTRFVAPPNIYCESVTFRQLRLVILPLVPRSSYHENQEIREMLGRNRLLAELEKVRFVERSGVLGRSGQDFEFWRGGQAKKKSEKKSMQPRTNLPKFLKLGSSKWQCQEGTKMHCSANNNACRCPLCGE